MRVIVDANVFISFLLKPSPERVPSQIVNAALAGQFDLLISDETLTEIAQNVAGKPYLSEQIPHARLEALFWRIREVATIVDELASPIPSVTRDRKDDYLIAHALAEEVDTLVSGDRDLLALDGSFPFRILAPTAFVAALDQESGTSH
jgi:uncharacterized protein